MSSRPREFLPALPGPGDLAILRPTYPGPAYRSGRPGGTDHYCGHCRVTRLAEGVVEGELWEVGFRCGRCGEVSGPPPWPGGRPLPQRAVTFERREYAIDAAIEGRDVALVAAPRPDAAAATDKEETLSTKTCAALLTEARRLVGPALYDEILASDERGKRSHTPPPRRHRLAALVESVERTGLSLKQDDEPMADVTSLVELRLAVDTFKRWEGDPEWPGIRSSLKAPDDFRHTVAVLACASFLADAGNAVALHRAASGRAADLRFDIGPREAGATELKAPEVLHQPTEPLTDDRAHKTVHAAWRSAKKQLADQPATLIIAGFHLRDSDREALASAARALLLARDRPNVQAIVIVSLGALLSEEGEARSLAATISLTVEANPSYTGSISLTQEPRPGLRRVEAATEVELAPRDQP